MGISYENMIIKSIKQKRSNNLIITKEPNENRDWREDGGLSEIDVKIPHLMSIFKKKKVIWCSTSNEDVLNWIDSTKSYHYWIKLIKLKKEDYLKII